MESEGDRDGVGHRQRRERKEGRLYHDSPPVDLQASRLSWGGSLISQMTEQPPHMSHSSACPGPPLLPLSPPWSHIPTCPLSSHPYLPSRHHSPSSHGYHCHSPSPSSCGPCYCSPSPHYCSPSPCYCSPSPHYHSPSPLS